MSTGTIQFNCRTSSAKSLVSVFSETAGRLRRGKPATECLWGPSVVSSQGIFPDSTRHIGAFSGPQNFGAGGQG